MTIRVELVPSVQEWNEGFFDLNDWATTGTVALADQGAPFPEPLHGWPSLLRAFQDAIDAGLLVAPGVGVVRREGCDHAEAVAAGRLDLDDVGSEVGQQGGAERAGVGHRAVDDGDVLERTRSSVGRVVAGRHAPRAY